MIIEVFIDQSQIVHGSKCKQKVAVVNPLGLLQVERMFIEASSFGEDLRSLILQYLIDFSGEKLMCKCKVENYDRRSEHSSVVALFRQERAGGDLDCVLVEIALLLLVEVYIIIFL